MEEPPQIRKTVSTSELVTSEYDEMELAESITDTGFKQITPSNSAEAMEEPELLDLGFNTTNPTGNTSRNLSQITPSPSAETMEDPDDYESELIDLSFNTTNPKSFTSRGLSQFPPLPIAETMEEPTQIKRAVSTSALKTSASDELSSILTSQDDSTLFDRPRDGRSCNIEAMFKSLSLSKE